MNIWWENIYFVILIASFWYSFLKLVTLKIIDTCVFIKLAFHIIVSFYFQNYFSDKIYIFSLKKIEKININKEKDLWLKKYNSNYDNGKKRHVLYIYIYKPVSNWNWSKLKKGWK
jgi:hypothetical protein